MGFSGYYQRICGNGHYYTTDALSEMYGSPTACDMCDSDLIVEENLVDTTNGCEFNAEPCPCRHRKIITLPDGKETLGEREAHGQLRLHKRRKARYALKDGRMKS